MTDIPLDPAIAAYFHEANGSDYDALTACFQPDAVVIDEEHIDRGSGEIRAWLQRAREEYNFTSVLVAASEADGQTLVTCLVTGDFPGSPVHLCYSFTVVDDRIATLKIV